jgi:hypothetical protein
MAHVWNFVDLPAAPLVNVSNSAMYEKYVARGQLFRFVLSCFMFTCRLISFLRSDKVHQDVSDL